VIPNDLIKWIRDVLRGLEGQALCAFSAIQSGSFDKLSKSEVTRNNEGARAGEMFTG
jgi:hypothetical protein